MREPGTRAPVVIIGLDSATLDLVGPWMEADELPNLRFIAENGASGTLRSTFPHFSSVAWTSISTGKNPGKHGVFDFIELKNGSYDTRVTNRASARARSVWSYLAERGHRVGLINMPWTWPPEPLEDGFVIAGMGSPRFDASIFHPPELYEEIEERVGKYSLTPLRKSGDGLYDFEALHREADRLTEATKYLLREKSPDVLAVVEILVDQIQHFYWKSRRATGKDGRQVEDMLLYVHKLLDEKVGEIMQEAGEYATIVVLSDHGAGPVEGGLNLPAALERIGVTRYERAVTSGLRSRAKNVLAALHQETTKRYPGALKLARRVVGKRLKDRAMMGLGVRYGDIKWEETRAFCWGVHGAIQVNLKGREPRGVVEPGEEYEALRDEIISGLEVLRDHRGEPVVDAVYRREEVWEGPAVQDAPDLFVQPGDGIGIVNFFTDPAVFLNFRAVEWEGSVKEGNHRADGMLIAKGPRIEAGSRLEGAGICDVAPTLLRLFGEPVPPDMDGRVLEEMFGTAERPARRLDGEAAE